ncbi:MAG: DUF3078 domain-containing protein [Bacteroidales bacterium]|nr:DUF3078 domain-containing protein [Bacteroidales bacterium]
MKHSIIATTLCVLTCLHARAQDNILSFYLDSLHYNSLGIPAVFDGVWVNDSIKLHLGEDKKPDFRPNPFTAQAPKILQLEFGKWGDDYLFIQRLEQTARSYFYRTAPHLVKYNLDMFPKSLPEMQVIETHPLRGLFKPEIETLANINRISRIQPKDVYWWKIATTSLSFSQASFSENWHKGGENNIMLLSIQNLKFGYNNKSNFEFETEIEAKFGFYSTPKDTIRAFRVNDDLSFLKSKLGYKAYKSFYYSLSMDFRTQLFNNYKTNSRDRSASFLSPANLYFSVGMDYKLSKKKIILSVMPSPFSYRLIYVKDPKVNETVYGIKKGKKIQETFGSRLDGNMTWKCSKQLMWVSRLYYFTSYEKSEADWENTLDFILNRYLSTKFIAHLRYDDGVQRSDDFGYFQVREMLTFGITYRW